MSGAFAARTANRQTTTGISHSIAWENPAMSYQSANNAETEVGTEPHSGLDLVLWLQTEIQPVLDRANRIGESVVNHDILSGETWIVC